MILPYGYFISPSTGPFGFERPLFFRSTDQIKVLMDVTCRLKRNRYIDFLQFTFIQKKDPCEAMNLSFLSATMDYIALTGNQSSSKYNFKFKTG